MQRDVHVNPHSRRARSTGQILVPRRRASGKPYKNTWGDIEDDVEKFYEGGEEF